MKKLTFMILFLISIQSNAQNKLKLEVLESILKYEIENSDNVLYLECIKPKTDFDYQDFIKQISFDIQIEVLEELEKNASRSEVRFWKSKWMWDLSKNSKSIENKNCLTKKDVSKLFEKTGKRNSVLSISDPIFSDNNEYCIVSISYLMFPGSAHGNSYFLQKIKGVWSIKATYDSWLS